MFSVNIFAQDDRKADMKKAEDYFKSAKQLTSSNLLDSAKNQLLRASDIYYKYSFWENYLICYSFMGEIEMNKSAYKDAVGTCRKLVDKTIEYKGKSFRNLPNAYRSLGKAFFYTNKFDSSEIYIHKSLDLFKTLKGDSSLDEASCFNVLGNIYAQKADLKMALEYYNKDLAIRRKVLGDNHPDVASAYSNIAKIYNETGDYNTSLDYSNKAIEMKTQAKNDKNPETAMSYYNLANTYIDKQEFDQALQYAMKALEIRREIYADKNMEVAQSYQQLGIVYKEKDDYDIAIQYDLLALDILREAKSEQSAEVAGLYNNIGQLHLGQKNYDVALKYFLNAADIQRAISGENHSSMVAIYNNIGTLYWNKNDFDSATIFQEKAINLSQKIYGDKNPKLVLPFLNIANNYFDQAKKHYDPNIIGKSLINFQKSIAANVKNLNPEETNFYANPSIVNYFDQKNLLSSLQGKAKTLATKYKFDSTIYDLEASNTTYLICDTLIDKIRQSITSKSDKIDLGAKSSEIYEDATNGFIELYQLAHDKKDFFKANQYLRQAFLLSEKNKSATLLEAISGAQAQKFAGIPDSLLELERSMNIDIAYYEKQLALFPDQDEEKRCRDKLFELNRQVKKFIEELEKKYPKYYEMKYSSNKSVSIEQIQKMLDKKTQMRSYFLASNLINIFVITSDSIVLKRVEKPTDFEKSIEDMRSMILSGKSKQMLLYQTKSLEIYQSLFKDSIPASITKLLIIPDGILGSIPFEALLTKKFTGEVKAYKDYPYLIKRFTCYYTYSANLYYKTFENQADTKNRATKDFIGIAPGFMAGNSQEFGGERVEPLAGSLTEVEQISKNFTDKSLAVITKINKDANEEFVRTADVKNFKFVHIATHGFVNPEKPELSGILLSKDTVANYDGVLFSGEIYNLSLNCDLITLSACETGLGKITKGEGIIGLSRALLYAGTKNIIVSLWKVSDESTSKLMIDFYDNLLLKYNSDFSKPVDFAESLRDAKLKLINEGKFPFPHPYFWSPFILIGK